MIFIPFSCNQYSTLLGMVQLDHELLLPLSTFQTEHYLSYHLDRVGKHDFYGIAYWQMTGIVSLIVLHDPIQGRQGYQYKARCKSFGSFCLMSCSTLKGQK